MKMTEFLDRLNDWRELTRTEYTIEDPSVEAGREAEKFLRTLVETNLKYKGAFCFLGKRVPSQIHGCRFEIDLIVLTKKHLHFLEVKNWSGDLIEKNGSWVQIRRNGEQIEHPDLTKENSKKQQAVVDYLKLNGLEIDSSYFTQKVIFMNQNLRISSSIESNSDVVPCYRLNNYLSAQKGASYAERFIHSAIEMCLDSEKSNLVLDGLFHAMHSKNFEIARNTISKLETWDKVVLYGGKVLTGDCLKLFADSSPINFKSLPSGSRFKVAWTRQKVLGILQVLLTKIPLGRIRMPDKWIPVKPKDILKFHCAGDEHPCEINMQNVNYY
jgi:hypothetical protein